MKTGVLSDIVADTSAGSHKQESPPGQAIATTPQFGVAADDLIADPDARLVSADADDTPTPRAR
jgi:hypothetical protein